MGLRYFLKQGTSLGYFHSNQRAPFDVVGSLEYCSAVASTVGATGKPQLVLCS